MFKDQNKEGKKKITAGTLAGAITNAAIGNVGVAACGTAVGVGAGSMMATGAAIGAAGHAIKNSDNDTTKSAVIGAASGAGLSATIGGIGIAAMGTAVGLGTVGMTVAGAVGGLAVDGAKKSFQKESIERVESDVFTELCALENEMSDSENDIDIELKFLKLLED